MHPRPREIKLALKKSRILNEIFQTEQCSRFDLARRLNINATMVGHYVDEFLREGLLVEGEPVQSRPGRAPTPLQPNPEHGCFLGLDFEALRARAVLCDFAGEPVIQEEIPLRAGARREDVLGEIRDLALRVADQATCPVLTVGIAAPGQVDCTAGRILHYRLIRNFDQVPVREHFESVFDVPVFVEDNIRAVAFGELLRGSGRGCENFLCLAARSGVGLGIVIGGKLYRGGAAGVGAGEVAYMVVPTREGPRLITDLVSATGFVNGVKSLLESWQNTAARKRLAERRDELSLADVVAVAEAGDPLLQERLEELGSQLGMLAANLANLFAPEKIVLTGEVPTCSPLVRQSMERSFREYTLPPLLRTVYLEDGMLGGFAGALGAALLGFETVFPDDEGVVADRVRAKRKRQAALTSA